MTAAAEAGTTGIRRVVVEVITGLLPHLPAGEVTDDKSLQDLGADSVDRVEIITVLRDRLARDEALSSFADLPDVGALVAHLDRVGTP